MKSLALFTILFAFNFKTYAQIEFGALIDKSITQQQDTAADLSKSTQMANNSVEGDTQNTNNDLDKPYVDSNTTTEKTANHQEVQRDPAKEKDFTVSLHKTGRQSAARYFPPKVKEKKSSKKVAKNSKKTKNHKYVAKNSHSQKSKKSRTTASVKSKQSKKHKKTKHKT